MISRSGVGACGRTLDSARSRSTIPGSCYMQVPSLRPGIELCPTHQHAAALVDSYRNYEPQHVHVHDTRPSRALGTCCKRWVYS